MRVLTSDAHAQHQAPWGKRRNVHDLPSDENWMAKRQQVDADHRTQDVALPQNGCRAHEAVHASSPQRS